MPPTPVTKRSKTPSNIWKFFSKLSPKEAKCSTCLKKLVTSGNTSNLWDHLKRKHKNLITESQNEDLVESSVSSTDLSNNDKGAQISSQNTLESAFSNIRSFSRGGIKQEALKETLAYMIVKDCLPFDIVEGTGFQQFVKQLEPKFKIPHRKTITKYIDSKFDSLKPSLKEKIKLFKWMSLTSDIWTDSMNIKSYLSLTIHYIENADLKKSIIAVKPLDVVHSSENIQTSIEEIFKDWEISKDKISCCVTDGASNIVKAFKDVVGGRKHLHCFAHLLNLTANDAISSLLNLKTLITIVKDTVTFFKQSVKAADQLRMEQEKAGIEIPLKPIQEVKTRWNSTFFMLDRFSKLHKFIVTVLVQFNNTPSLISREQLDTINEVIKILKPLETVTREISGEEYTTISKIIPLIRGMKLKISTCNLETEIGKNLQKSLNSNFDKRFGKIEESKILAISTILDPRFKTIHFEKPLALSTALKSLDTEVKMYKGLVAENQRNNEEEHDVSLSLDDAWAFHKSAVNTIRNSIFPEDCTTYESSLHQYLDLNCLEEISVNPLEYWIKHEKVYPYLKEVADKYLSIVATSVPSERTFSSAGNLITEKRNRIHPKRVEKLLILSNFSYSDFVKKT